MTTISDPGLADPTISAEAKQVRAAIDTLLAEHDPATANRTAFLHARYDAGLGWVWFPKGFGGLDLSPQHQGTIEAAMRKAKAPSGAEGNVIGYGMGAPTVVTHGTDEQRQRLLPPLFTGEEIWCQLFSEPGAGSDVAGLATSAVKDGDEWIVNGQKVWTSFAHRAKWGMLLARTDPNVPKHRGLTYFVVDMQAPGVEVRPLRQITGHAEFNEVFFSDARIPDSMRLDEVGAGWRVAMTTLMNERVSIGGGVATRRASPIQMVLKLWSARDDKNAVMRDRVMQLYVQSEVNRLTNQRARELRKVGTPGPEGSVGKLAGAELNQRIYELAVDLMGAEGTLYPLGYELDRSAISLMGGAGDGRAAFLRSRANSIEGGTSEIMRNILGERVLGLPGEPRLDKDAAWADVPRG